MLEPISSTKDRSERGQNWESWWIAFRRYVRGEIRRSKYRRWWGIRKLEAFGSKKCDL